MVSNQSVRRSPGTVAGIAGTLSVLALAGCQHLSSKDTAPVAAALLQWLVRP